MNINIDLKQVNERQKTILKLFSFNVESSIFNLFKNIGIDKSGPAIKVVRKRLSDMSSSLFSKVEYEFLKEV